MYNDYYNQECDFSELKGKVLKRVENRGDSIFFETVEGAKYQMVYYNDCCESVSIEEIHGDLEDLVGAPILMAEESTSREPAPEIQALRYTEKEERKAHWVATGNDPENYYDYSTEYSETWTFYKAATIKGSVTIRWYGSSNGYYSETATFEEIKG